MIKNKLQMAAKGVANPASAVKHISKKTRNACCNASVFYNSIRPIGTPVFSEDWDMLVILDTCRPDILRTVQSEYDFLTEIDTIWSTGAMSAEWMATTFDREWKEEINDCGYITANPHSKTVIENNLESRWRGSGHHTDRLNKYGMYDIVNVSELGYYQPVWQNSTELEEDHDLWGDPRKVTEAAIQAEKSKELDRIILHYMPPHFPYIGEAVQQDREDLFDYESTPFDYINRTGERDKVINAYTDTLRYILDEVQLLLENMDRDKVIITADHGEAFGEYGTFKHPTGSLNPMVRRVPWVETSAQNKSTLTLELEEKQKSVPVEQRLEALGYK